jgi:small nuclear ribonucleoprotein D3
MSIGVPIKVLHEAEGHIVTLETIMGELFRGKLVEAEDNMNCLLMNITVTYRDGRTAQLEQVYVRGSKIRFLILPDMLKNAPMFKNIKGPKSAQGRGKTAIIRATVKTRGGAADRGGRGGSASAGGRGSNVYSKSTGAKK